VLIKDYFKIDISQYLKKRRKKEKKNVPFLCPVCNQVYEIFSNSRNSCLKYHPDFPKYGLNKKICPICEENEKE
jgi:hypothetical protein